MIQKKGYTHSFAHNANLAAGAVLQMVNPAANVRGLIIRKISTWAYGGSWNLNAPAILAKASAPANVTDGDVIGGPTSAQLVNGVSASFAHESTPDLFVPPGKGVYYVAGGAAEGAGFHSMLYELL
jgi:hypothetical protein